MLKTIAKIASGDLFILLELIFFTTKTICRSLTSFTLIFFRRCMHLFLTGGERTVVDGVMKKVFNAENHRQNRLWRFIYFLELIFLQPKQSVDR